MEKEPRQDSLKTTVLEGVQYIETYTWSELTTPSDIGVADSFSMYVTYILYHCQCVLLLLYYI